MIKMASQVFFVIIKVVKNYRKHLDRIDGDILVIPVSPPLMPLGGIASAVDWRLNSIISHTIAEERFNGHSGSLLLIPSNNKINSRFVLLVGFGKNFKNEITKTLKGLKINDLCIVISKQFKKEIKASTFEANTVKEHDIGEEKLFIFKGVEI